MGTYGQDRNGDVRDNRYGFYSFPKIITETKNITITSGTAGYAQRIDGLRLTGYDLDIRYLGGVFVNCSAQEVSASVSDVIWISNQITELDIRLMRHQDISSNFTATLHLMVVGYS